MRILYLTQWFEPEPGVIKGPRSFDEGLRLTRALIDELNRERWKEHPCNSGRGEFDG